MVPLMSSVYVLGPALALGAAAGLGASLRRLFTSEPDTAPRRATPAAVDDYGLLRSVAYVEDLDTAHSVRALLKAGRVRSTVSTGRDGLVRVLVFPGEYDRARRLVSWVL